MRNIVMLLALAGVSACNKPSSKEAAAEPTVATVSFDGSDYKDEAAKLAHGKRLADVLDCTGCHGLNLQGTNVTADDPSFGDMNAPNLTLKLRDYSDADFMKLLRTGVPKDGREFWFMAPAAYQFVSDRDLQAVLAYMRSFKPAGTQLPPIRKGKGFNDDVAKGMMVPATRMILDYQQLPPPAMGPQFERGRQMTRATCADCHNSALQGLGEFTPDLDIAGTYSAAELTELLSTGKGKTKADLGLMSEMGRHAYSKLTPAERKAIVDYVLARAHRRSEGHEPER